MDTKTNQQTNLENKSMTKLRDVLKAKGISQADLIKIIKEKNGIEFDKGNMSRIINGVKTNFTIETAKIISKALGVKIDEIID